jgi:hypothetical protein
MAAATWSVGGFYLGLGPTILGAAFHLNGGDYGGLAIAALTGAGAVTSLLLGSASPRILAVGGTAAMSAGISAALLSIATRAASLFFVSAAIAGSGFGAASSAYLRRSVTLWRLRCSSRRDG